MKTLQDIIQGLDVLQVQGDSQLSIQDLSLDSRVQGENILYMAMPGTRVDGHDFIPQAISGGAVAVLCQHIPEGIEGITFIQVASVPSAAGIVCRNFFDKPDESMEVVGVTGTNGKTTVATLLYQLFSLRGETCGLLSTVEYRIGNTVYPSTHTTPDVISVYRNLSAMAKAGCNKCFMEVSSHAAHQQRIGGIQFTGAIFTNITHDHLDYHKTFDAYIKAKKSFFDNLPSSAFAVTNKDEKNGMVMLQNTRATKYTYSLHGTADFNCRIMECDFNGTQLQINGKEIWVSLVGEFNAYNLAAVYGAAFLLTQGDPDLEVQLSALPRVNGRFEAIQGPERKTAIVDYAHTPDALENVLDTINKIRSRGEKLITVVGCGGNRDAAKRPEMAKIATRLSDQVILTSDNPRDEDPESILDEMQAGVEAQHYKKVLRISDRKEAIKVAAALAGPGDVILIAGKGHETYQEIKGIKHPFDDKAIIKDTFNTTN